MNYDLIRMDIPAWLLESDDLIPTYKWFYLCLMFVSEDGVFTGTFRQLRAAIHFHENVGDILCFLRDIGYIAMEEVGVTKERPHQPIWQIELVDQAVLQTTLSQD